MPGHSAAAPSPENSPVFVLLGSTGSGKTAVSLPLAERLPAEIVCLDSKQIFRDMAIGTAQPTPEELADHTRQALARYIDNPNVVVRVAATGSRHFFVMGNVRAPGMYDLRAGQTMIQALAVAGGFTEFANESRVKILRGGAAPIERDYDEVVQGKLPDVLLEPNDTIVVP